jgi:hypothetical protein
MCNGIGKCNFDTAVCDCPHGWTYDATLGPCARIVVNNTRWAGTHSLTGLFTHSLTYLLTRSAGLARCPGVVSPELDINGNWVTSLQDKPNYSPRIYLSINPSLNHDYQYPATIGTFSLTYSLTHSPTHSLTHLPIEMFDYEVGTIPSIVTASRVLLKNLSSETSAGPLAHDQSVNRLYYVDQHSTSPYIGYIQLNTTGYSSSRKLVDVNYVIYGFTFDARFNQRYTHSLIGFLTYWLTHLLTHSVTNSLTHSLTYLLTALLTHLITHSLTHTLTHSLTHSLLYEGGYTGLFPRCTALPLMDISTTWMWMPQLQVRSHCAALSVPPTLRIPWVSRCIRTRTSFTGSTRPPRPARRHFAHATWTALGIQKCCCIGWHRTRR